MLNNTGNICSVYNTNVPELVETVTAMSEAFPNDFKFPSYTHTHRRLRENKPDWHTLLYMAE